MVHNQAHPVVWKQAPTITILFPLDASGQQGHSAQCTAVNGAGLSRGQLLQTIYTFYQVVCLHPITWTSSS